MEKSFVNLKNKSGLVHCISNYVTINDLANIILASSASPIMADEAREVEEIVAISNSLLINIGTLNESTVKSMLLAGKKASQLNIPLVLDPVGMGVSKLRTETVNLILREAKPSLIKGNATEIKSLASGEKSTSGVDVSELDILKESNLDSYIDLSKKLAKKYETIIFLTGEIDIITDGRTSYLIRNGHIKLTNITGAGCMLGGVVAAYLAANKDNMLEAALAAGLAFGISGELAGKKAEKSGLGLASFKNFLIDELSLLDLNKLKENANYETR